MLAAVALALPWVLLPLVTLARVRRVERLRDYTAEPPANAPLVSVIIPARNEAANITRCVQSVLTSHWPSLEVLVIDDHSTDGTGALARAIAATDDRLRVLEAPPLPDGWFGKQWACDVGAHAARGTWLLFIDADTWHWPAAIPRLMAFAAARGARVVTTALRLELGSFWEWLVLPPILFVLLTRVGGSEKLANAKRAQSSATNGQCLLVERTLYDQIGGHAAVRHNVAEDVLFGQLVWRAGHRVHLASALDEMGVRMYTDLASLRAGWTKNLYAGGKYALWPGLPAWSFAPLLVAPVVVLLIPIVVLLLWAMGVVPAVAGMAGAIAYLGLAAWMLLFNRFARVPAWAALLWPLGVAMAGAIMVEAVWRGDRVEWKGRAYVSR